MQKKSSRNIIKILNTTVFVIIMNKVGNAFHEKSGCADKY